MVKLGGKWRQMPIYITNQAVTKDGAPLNDVAWVDIDQCEASIFCHDREGRKIPTDTDPTGYETLLVRGTFTVTSSQVAKDPCFTWEGMSPPCFTGEGLGYPACVTSGNANSQSVDFSAVGVDSDGRNGGGVYLYVLSCVRQLFPQLMAYEIMSAQKMRSGDDA